VAAEAAAASRFGCVTAEEAHAVAGLGVEPWSDRCCVLAFVLAFLPAPVAPSPSLAEGRVFVLAPIGLVIDVGVAGAAVVLVNTVPVR
jgi:hypothetical protein